jgi:hypothetical protein
MEFVFAKNQTILFNLQLILIIKKFVFVDQKFYNLLIIISKVCINALFVFCNVFVMKLDATVVQTTHVFNPLITYVFAKLIFLKLIEIVNVKVHSIL